MPNMTFEDIKAAVSIEKVAQMLDLRATVTKPSYFRMGCPGCKRGGDKILQITTAGHWSQTFRCFAAEVTGDCVALTAHVLGISQGQAAEKIKSHFGLNNSSTAPSPPPEAEDTPPVAGMKPLEYLEPIHEAVQSLGISGITADLVGIGHSGTKCTMKNRVLIPIRLPDGTLIGYCGIKLDDEVPFKFPDNLESRATGDVVKFDRRKA